MIVEIIACTYLLYERKRERELLDEIREVTKVQGAWRWEGRAWDPGNRLELLNVKIAQA